MVGDGVTTDRAGEMKHGSRAGTLITVFVLTLQGRTLTVELTDETKVREIALCLRNKLGIPVDDHRLVYGGKLPMDSKTMYDYNIGALATLHLTVGLSGGCPDSARP